MKIHRIGLLIAITSWLHIHCCAAVDCDAVLRPNEEYFKDNRSLLFAYMSLHAESEYDRLQKMDQRSREADAAYKAFSGEYKSSNSRREFSEKVRLRLDQEKFLVDEKSARASYRKFVSDKQVEEWGKCVGARGGLLLRPRPADKSGFVLKAAWRPPFSRGTGEFVLKIDGGKIDNQTRLTEKWEGSREGVFIVKPDANVERILITAQITGFAEDIMVDLRPPPAPPSPAPPAPARLVGVRWGPEKGNSGNDCRKVSNNYEFAIELHGGTPSAFATLRIDAKNDMHSRPKSHVAIGSKVGLPPIYLVNASKLILEVEGDSFVLADFHDPNPSQCQDHEFHILNATLMITRSGH